MPLPDFYSNNLILRCATMSFSVSFTCTGSEYIISQLIHVTPISKVYWVMSVFTSAISSVCIIPSFRILSVFLCLLADFLIFFRCFHVPFRNSFPFLTVSRLTGESYFESVCCLRYSRLIAVLFSISASLLVFGNFHSCVLCSVSFFLSIGSLPSLFVCLFHLLISLLWIHYSRQTVALQRFESFFSDIFLLQWYFPHASSATQTSITNHSAINCSWYHLSRWSIA